MNKIFKTVWNEATQSWMAVSELAKTQGKSVSGPSGILHKIISKLFKLSASALAVVSVLFSTTAQAENVLYVNDGTDQSCGFLWDNAYYGASLMHIGGTIWAQTPTGAINNTTRTAASIGLPGAGNGCSAGATKDTQTSYATIYNGNNTTNFTLGGRLDVNSGTLGLGSRADSKNTIKIGSGTTLTQANQLNSISIGVNTTVSDEYSVAIGPNATVTKNNAVAIGSGAKANAHGAIAVGIGAEALAGTNDVRSIAIGGQAKAKNDWAISVGDQAEARGVGSVSIGVLTESSGFVASSLGWRGLASGDHSVVIGTKAIASAENAFALGYDANSTAKNSLSLGYSALSTGKDAIAIGTGTTVNGEGSGLIGRITSTTANEREKASANPTKVRTTTATFTGTNTYVIGNDNLTVTANSAGAFGNSNKLAGNNSRVVGNGSETTATATDSMVIGNGNKTESKDSVVLGKSSTISTNADNSFALGVGAQVQANAKNSVAFGSSAKTNGENAIAIGNGAQALAKDTISIGTGNKVSGIGSGAFGDPNTVTGAGSYAFGNNNTIANNNTFVLGSDVTSSQNNAVILGKDSADKAHQDVNDVTINNLKFGTFQGTPVGVVSVGKVGAERQLVNVAAGAISATSTDAINGSQLYATNAVLAAVANSAQSVLGAATGGSGFSLANNGTLTATNIGGTGQATVNDAIAHLRTGGIKVNADNNNVKVNSLGATLSVVSGNATNTSSENLNTKVEQDGTGTKITVSMKKDPNFDSLSLTAAGGVKTTLTPTSNGLTLATGGANSKLSGVATATAGDSDDVAANKGYVDSAVNSAGWTLKGDGATKDTAVVKGDSVDFIDGDGTDSVVTNAGTASTVKYNVKTVTLTNGVGGVVTSPNPASDKVFATAGNVADVVNAAVNGLSNKGITVNADTGGQQTHKLGNELVIAGGNATGAVSSTNLKTTVVQDASGKTTVTVAMKDAPTFTAVTATTAIIGSGTNTTTLTSTADGLSVGGDRITNVGDAINATDAVNKKQLDAVGNGVGTLSGATYNPATGTYTAPTGGFGGTGANNLNDAIAAVKNTANQPLSFTGNSGTKIDRTLGQTLKIEGGLATTAAASNKNIRTETAGDTVKILLADAPIFTAVTATTATIGSGTNTTTLTSTADGLSVGGDRITNVGNAVNTGDAVNKGQMDTAIATAKTEAKGYGWVLQQGGGVKDDKVIDSDVVNFVNGNGTTALVTTNAGKTGSNVTFNVKTSGFTSGTDGKVTGVTAGDSFATAADVAAAINNAVDKVSSGAAAQSFKLQANGDTASIVGAATTVQFKNGDNINITRNTTNPYDITIATAKEVKFDKTTVGTVVTNGTTNKISGLAAGTVSSTSTEAVNGGQLYGVANNVKTVLGGSTAIAANGTLTTTNLGGTGTNTVHDAIAAVKATADSATTKSNLPLSFTGNSGTKIDRTLGQTLKIEGGLATTEAASNKNIRTETAGDTVKILLADAPIFTAVTATTATIGSGTNTTTLTSTANGLDVGGDKITNVGDAVNASDAVNKKQLDAATKASTDGLTALKAQTFKLQANNDTASAVKSDDTVKFIDGKNVAISRSGNNITVATKDEVSFTKTTVGSVVTNGTTNKISGLAAGSVTSGSTEAVNGGQLFGVANSLKTLIGTPATLNSDGTVTTTNIGGTGSNTIHGAITEIKNIADSATKTLNSGNLQFSGDSGTKVTRNLGTELKIQGGKTTGLTDNNIGVVSDSTTNTLHVKLAKDINLGTTGSVKTGATTVNNSGVTIAHPSDSSKNVTLTGSGLNNGGNVISGVGKATAGDHAVNKDLLDSTVKAVTDSSNKALDGLKAQTFKLQVNGDTASAVKASDTVKFTDGKNVTITRSGNNITIATKDDVSFSKTTVGSVVTDSATNKISGLSGGTVASGSTEAITGGQLFAQSEGIKNLIGGNTTYNPTTGAFTNNNIGGTGKSTLNDAIMHINSTASAGWNLSAQGANQTKVAPNATVDLNNSDGNIVIAKTTASNDVTFNLAKDLSVDSVKANTFTAGNTTINNGGLTIANTDPTKAVSLTSGGLNNGGNKITNISAGTSATDAATIGQLSGITSALGGGASVDPNNGSIIAPSYQITQSDGSIKTVNSVGDAISSLNGMSSSPLTFAADSGTNIERRLGSTVSVNGDSKNITTSTTANGVKVELNNTINVSGVVADGVSIKGNGPTLTKNGMNMAGQAITNMANGLPTKIDANGNVVPMTTVDIKQAIIDGTLDASVLNNAVNVGDLVEQGNNVLNVSKNIYGADGDGNPYVRADGTISSAGRAALRTYNVDDNGTLEHNGIFDAIKNMNEQGIKFFHTNDGVVNSPNDGYSEEDSNANAAYSTAIGYKALVSKNAVAGLAIGPASLADGAYSVALGAESVAQEAHVADVASGGAYTYGGLNDNNVAAKATKATRVASIGAEGKERQLQHVAAGVISPTSTDAVNGSQLYYTNKAVENNTRAINQLRGDVHKMDRQLRAGIAGATALSFLQRPNQPGKSVVSLGVGGYRGESAVAIGYSRNSDNNKISIKVGAGVNTRSDINYGASIGYQW